MLDVNNLVNKAVDLSLNYGPKLVLAIVTLVVGFWVIGALAKTIRKVLEKRDVDPSLTPFLISVVSALLKALVVISVASMVGINTTSFIALLGAAGLAVGMALQGSLSNFAGGVLILILKPFKVGEYIQTEVAEGSVQEIQVFHTIMKTLDGKKVILPNGPLSNGKIVNFSSEPHRRVEFTFGISYEDSIDQAKDVLNKVIAEHPLVVKNPSATVAVTNHGESSVDFTVHVWCENSNYWSLYFDFSGRVKKAFDGANISIPFPQMDVHMPAKSQA